MVLTERLTRFGLDVARPLVVTAPGATAARLAVERALARRGGAIASSPADADTLIVCGAASATLHGVVERVWSQLPAPRARVDVLEPGEAEAALDRARAALVDVAAQRAAPPGGQPAPDGEAGGENSDDMMMPAGLPMAEQAPDRDGLKLDQLHLQLGPVLPDWPAGLILDVSVQGDVLQEVEVRTVPAAPGAYGPRSFWDEPGAARTAAAHLDSAARLLAVAGWADGAAMARRLRDDALDGVDVTSDLERFARRVQRARVLRWSLRGLGVLDHDEAVDHHVEGPALRAGGDVMARLRQWLIEAQAAAAGEPVGGEGPRGRRDGDPPSGALLGVLPRLVRGLDVASARLVVASLDPDLDQLAGVPAEVAGGR